MPSAQSLVSIDCKVNLKEENGYNFNLELDICWSVT